MPVSPKRRNPLTHVFVLIAACVLFFMLFANQVATQSMFMPGPSSYELGDDFRSIASSDGTEIAIFYQTTPRADKTIFYLHGNAEDLGDTLPILKTFALQGFNIISFDYRGYGATPGIADEANAYQDGLAVYDYLVKEESVEERSIILLGRSLGAGVATEIATQRNPAGLILQSAFRSVYRLFLPIKRIPGDKFVNESKLSRVECPVLLIHGTNDQVVPFSHGEALARSLPEDRSSVFWVEGAGHNDLLFVAGIAYWQRIRAFVSEL